MKKRCQLGTAFFEKKKKKMLTSIKIAAIINKQSTRRHQISGGIAQLGERLNGIQEVSGSIPLISTKKRKTNVLRFSFFSSLAKSSIP